MSLREMLFRARRAFLIQVGRLFAFQAAVPAPDIGSIPDLSITKPLIVCNVRGEVAQMLLNGTLNIFALHDYPFGEVPDWNRDPKTGRLAPMTFGKAIDYRNKALVGNIKYLWEPSRHLMIPALAQAYSITQDKKYMSRLVQILDTWITQCRFPYGPHWCSSLEAGIRLVNWSLAWRIIGTTTDWRTAGVADAFLQRWLTSIYRHLYFIHSYYSGHSSANNHLIGEAAGVYIGAATWPVWPGVVKLKLRARNILIDQAEAQNFPDGVNAEQAIAYQQFVLDFLLMAGLTGRDCAEPFPDTYWKCIERMLEYIAAVMDVAGNVPMIGDADDGYVVSLVDAPDFSNFRSLLASGAIVFNRPDFARKAGALDDKTRWLIKDADRQFTSLLSLAEPGPSIRREFPQGGYFVLGSAFDSSDEVRIVVDTGPLGLGSIAAHGHADALAFTLSVSGTPIIIDPGTYSYHSEPLWRNYFRGTSAHNTLRIDGLNQSEIGGNFLWNTHAPVCVRKHDVSATIQVVDASHDGYKRLSDPVGHRRVLLYDTATRVLTISDHIECKARHAVELFFHFSEFTAVKTDSSAYTIVASKVRMQLIPDDALSISLIRGDEELPLGWISYRFDSKIPTTTLRASAHITSAQVFTTTIKIL